MNEPVATPEIGSDVAALRSEMDLEQKQGPRTAFISGPLEVSNEYFDKYYRPLVDSAIAAGHSFVLGPVSGIDALALEYLRARNVNPARISVYMAGFEIDARPQFVRLITADLGPQAIVEAQRSDGTDALTTWDRDAAMTRASDYDILRFRTEREQKNIFGERWRPRVSNTERNWRRRQGNIEETVQYISHVDPTELKTSRLKQLMSIARAEGSNSTRCDGTCDGHRDVVQGSSGQRAFGFGNAGERRV